MVLMLSGGPGAGKSSSKSKFEKILKEECPKSHDAVVVNADSYRYLLVGRNIGNMDFGTLTYLEAAIIRDKVFAQLENLNKIGKCPHTIIDQVNPSIDRINFATDGGDTASLESISRYVITALWSAKKRGDETKRHVETELLLRLSYFGRSC